MISGTLLLMQLLIAAVHSGSCRTMAIEVNRPYLFGSRLGSGTHLQRYWSTKPKAVVTVSRGFYFGQFALTFRNGIARPAIVSD